MKRLNFLPILFILLVFSLPGYSQSISGTDHDFTTAAWNTSGTTAATKEICIVCHTPHNAMSVVDAPLWNHALSTATYTTYSSSTMQGVVGAPDGSSKLCLTCHDGTVALENFGGVSNAATATNVIAAGNKARIGSTLSDDHPVSFLYNTALATLDGGLRDPSVAVSGLGGTIAANMLTAGKMQCSSCHDVHNGGSAGVAHLLVKSNAASALCLTCHIK
jgi:predicted CXXCH cytochrome family protein